MGFCKWNGKTILLNSFCVSSHYMSILNSDQNHLDMVESNSSICLSVSGLLNTLNLYAQTILVLRGYTQISHSEYAVFW